MIKKLLTAMTGLASIATVAFGLAVTPALAQSTDGTITISVREYKKMVEAIEADDKDKYWLMTYEQILEKERGNSKRAWELYEYWVLRTIYLRGTVNSSSVSTLIKDINILNEVSTFDPITIAIASGGGSVYDGLELYNAMLASRAPVNTRCDGMAASMAAVLLAVGDVRYASPACHFMIHEIAGNLPGGKSTDFLKWAEFAIDLEAMLFTILSENSGISMSDLRKMSIYEMFYDSEETLALGFIDEVLGSKPRTLADGSRVVPDELWPTNRIKRNLVDKVGE